MMFDKIFSAKIDLPTPPQTPICEENIFGNDEYELDFEVSNLNFNFEDIVNEIPEDIVNTNSNDLNRGDKTTYVREDCMWGSAEKNRLDNNATPSLDKTSRHRALVTPLNINLSNIQSISPKEKAEEEYSNDNASSTQNTFYNNEFLLTPAETESGK